MCGAMLFGENGRIVPKLVAMVLSSELIQSSQIRTMIALGTMEKKSSGKAVSIAVRRCLRKCEIVPCPRLQDVITHDAHFIPDINARESQMHLHFTTSLNGPWQFEGHGTKQEIKYNTDIFTRRFLSLQFEP